MLEHFAKQRRVAFESELNPWRALGAVAAHVLKWPRKLCLPLRKLSIARAMARVHRHWALAEYSGCGAEIPERKRGALLCRLLQRSVHVCARLIREATLNANEMGCKVAQREREVALWRRPVATLEDALALALERDARRLNVHCERAKWMLRECRKRKIGRCAVLGRCALLGRYAPLGRYA